jgi:iron-sulfur cluster assembly accessory protein
MFQRLKNQEWVKNKEHAKLRITVSFGGCSGFEYSFSLDDNPQIEEDDCLFVKDSAIVVVDKESLKHLNGATVDYKEELIRSSFVISDNPNSEQNCSCGTSFSSKAL